MGSILATGDITAFSDRRLKTAIEPIGGALAKLARIEGVTYERTDDMCGSSSSLSTRRRHAGLIAQDVEAILPEVVYTTQDEHSTKSIAYGNFTALIVQAVKELAAENAALRQAFETFVTAGNKI